MARGEHMGGTQMPQPLATAATVALTFSFAWPALLATYSASLCIMGIYGALAFVHLVFRRFHERENKKKINRIPFGISCESCLNAI